MGSGGGEDVARQQLEDGVGEAVAGRPGEVAAGGAGGPTLTCG